MTLITITIAVLIYIYILFRKGNTIEVETIQFNINQSNETQHKDTKTLKIAHLSDMHLRKNEFNRIHQITNVLKREKPDIILMTGDMIDSLVFDDSLSILCKELSIIAPTYAVSGNHEELYNDYKKYIDILEENNITILNNKCTVFNDLCFAGVPSTDLFDVNKIKDIDLAKDRSLILLAHRPENFELHYNHKNNIHPNLIFSGHAHGGQFRFFNRGVYSPQQGLLPIYTSGLYKLNSHPDGSMIVSRGVGHSDIPVRLNNPMHIPIVYINY